MIYHVTPGTVDGTERTTSDPDEAYRLFKEAVDRREQYVCLEAILGAAG